jgi:uncharacterized protein (TIGR02246 family)
MSPSIRIVLLGVSLLFVGGLLSARATWQSETPPAKTPEKKQPEITGRLSPAQATVEREAINQRINMFTDSYNKADLEGLMSIWTDDAEFIADTGKAYRGKEAIGVLLKRSLANNKGSKQSIRVLSVRFIKSDLALETGEVTLIDPTGAADTGKYEALWLKIGDKWYLNRIRDIVENGEESDVPEALTQLKPLAWLVGEWSDKDGRGDVSLVCKWGHEMTYLLLEFQVKRGDGKLLTVSQRIGFDAADGTLRSWVFDSAGGFGGGEWTREGNRWVIESGGTYPDGRGTSSIDTWKYVNDDEFTWSSVNREVDEVPLPDLSVTFVKKPAR